TFGLEPMYHRNIGKALEGKAAAMVSMIDASDTPISSRTFAGLILNESFWANFLEAVLEGQLDLENCCVDISDSTLGNVRGLESVYPCVLHESVCSFGGEGKMNVDTPEIVRLRGMVLTQGSVNETVSSGGNMQMAVGRLSADGK